MSDDAPRLADVFGIDFGDLVRVAGSSQAEVCTVDGCTPADDQLVVPELPRLDGPKPDGAAPVDEATPVDEAARQG